MKSKDYARLALSKAKKIDITIWEEIKSDFIAPRLDLLWKDSHIENQGGVVYFVYTLIK